MGDAALARPGRWRPAAVLRKNKLIIELLGEDRTGPCRHRDECAGPVIDQMSSSDPASGVVRRVLETGMSTHVLLVEQHVALRNAAARGAMGARRAGDAGRTSAWVDLHQHVRRRRHRRFIRRPGPRGRVSTVHVGGRGGVPRRG